MNHNQRDNGSRDSVQIKLDFLGERPSCDHGKHFLKNDVFFYLFTLNIFTMVIFIQQLYDRADVAI